MCFHQRFSQWGLCSLNFVLTSKIRCSWKNNFHSSNASFKAVQKNMLKAWDYTKNKLCHRYFDNATDISLIIFRTNILKISTGQLLLIVALMVLVALNFRWKLLIKMIPSLLVFHFYISLNFKNCNVSICRGTPYALTHFVIPPHFVISDAFCNPPCHTL